MMPQVKMRDVMDIFFTTTGITTTTPTEDGRHLRLQQVTRTAAVWMASLLTGGSDTGGVRQRLWTVDQL